MLGKLLERAANQTTPISITDWAKMFRPGGQVSYNGSQYQAFKTNQGYGGQSYDCNSVVFACATTRILLFSEAEFQYQRMVGPGKGQLWGDATLAILEQPWPGHSTRDLLAQAELDILCAGNSYWVHDGDRLLRLEPENVKILTERPTEQTYTGLPVGQRLLAYIYMTKDAAGNDRFVVYDPPEVAHYMPHPDRSDRFKGVSWLNSALPDIAADEALTQHKKQAISNGAQLGYVVTFDGQTTQEQFDYAVQSYRSQHEGPNNAGKTLFLGAGADVKTVGQSFENLAVKATQGGGETRIAAASGIPPVIVGLSEGLAQATYSNYGQARRRCADGTLRPLWGFFASAFQSLLNPPSGNRLWYDDTRVPFVREDVKDQADILREAAATVQVLVQAGFAPDACVAAVLAGDLTGLTGSHTGLFSVQLQPPTTADALSANDNPSMPAMNGATNNG